jgi:nucleoside-diphosphate-sugar epimerase
LIVGGNRFYGKRLAERLRDGGCHVTLVNRTGTGEADRIVAADRKDVKTLERELGKQTFDAVFDMSAYNPPDCPPMFQVFAKRTKRYVLVSSIAVYRLGKDLVEEDFKAAGYAIPNRPKLSYMEGKRAVEALFARDAPFPFVALRIPFILGEEDYTNRLEFHIDACRAKRAIFFCNRAATMHVVSADEAAEFAERVAKTDFVGPINYASSEPISYTAFMDIVGGATKQKALYAKKQTATNSSPYDHTSDKYMSLDKVRALGVEPRSVQAWLPDLVRTVAARATEE